MGSKRGGSHHPPSSFIQLPVLPEAACVGIPTEMFISDDGDGHQVQFNPRPAIRICRGCPEIEPCLEYALEHPLLTGVWGGTMPNDRAVIRTERAAS
jgi:WhiB family redox-sensing transcriptional regulator